MALINVSYVATQSEVEFTTAETNKCGQLIDEVSEWVCIYTGQNFEDSNVYPKVPAVIQGVVCRAVIRGMNTDPSNLKALTVGDVTEMYGGLLDFPAGDLDILDAFGGQVASVQLVSNTFDQCCSRNPGIAAKFVTGCDCE